MKVVADTVTLYRYHPETGEDAENIDTTGHSDADKEALAAERRAGGKFYWLEEQEGGFSRCELANVSFVIKVAGWRLVINDDKPNAFKGVEIPQPLTPIPWSETLKAMFWQWVMWRVVAWKNWRESRRKIVWRCVAYHGAGRLITPRPMTEAQAVRWLRHTIDGSVAYVDRETGHIFYKPRP